MAEMEDGLIVESMPEYQQLRWGARRMQAIRAAMVLATVIVFAAVPIVAVYLYNGMRLQVMMGRMPAAQMYDQLLAQLLPIAVLPLIIISVLLWKRATLPTHETIRLYQSRCELHCTLVPLVRPGAQALRRSPRWPLPLDRDAITGIALDARPGQACLVLETPHGPVCLGYSLPDEDLRYLGELLAQWHGSPLQES